MNLKEQHLLYGALFAICIAAIFALAVFLTQYVESNESIAALVQKFGYVGVTLLGILGGFNFIIPIPGATFVPVFIASGLHPWGIILALAIGTTLADVAGYLIGLWGHHKVRNKNHAWYERLKTLTEKNSEWVPLVVFGYAAIIPYPNEVIVVPLSLLGFRFVSIFIPLLLGSIIYNAIVVYGVVFALEALQ